MSSNINGLNGPSLPVGGAGRASGASATASEGAAAVTAASGSSPSEVQITASANLLATVARQLQSVPVVNEARVAQLRTAIENGSYTVQPEVIAAHLMQFEQSLAQISGG
jgi:negative regulator of flagellin synthesis FlgM